MTELKSYDVVDIQDYRVKVYLKYEADKVIAELKAQKAQAEDDCAYWKMREGNAVNAMHETEEACMFLTKSERHNKYKRCLAMAKWCEATSLFYGNAISKVLYMDITNHRRQKVFRRFRHYKKWLKHWLELAEKFKPGKE